MKIEPHGKSSVNLEEAASAGGVVHSRRSLVDDVYDRLIELLMQEDVAPGQRIPIDALARAWQVSQTPIREAMARAEESGLVVREPLKGFTVAPLLTPEEFDQLMDMRLLIEPYCAAQACARMHDNTIVELEHQTTIMKRSPRGPTSTQYRDYMRADIAFHELIASTSGNRFLSSSLSAASSHAHRFRRFGQGTVTDADEAVREHEAVLDALRARDAKAASTAMRNHLRGVEQRGRLAAEQPKQGKR
jgi:DNA-binding GntR family transcriptional regulator